MSALTGPFNCATHSPYMGTSCCLTSATVTSGATTLACASFFVHPVEDSTTKTATIDTRTRFRKLSTIHPKKTNVLSCGPKKDSLGSPTMLKLLSTELAKPRTPQNQLSCKLETFCDLKAKVVCSSSGFRCTFPQRTRKE